MTQFWRNILTSTEETKLLKSIIDLAQEVLKLKERIKALEDKSSVVNHTHYHYNSDKTYLPTPTYPQPYTPWQPTYGPSCAQKDLG